MTDLTFDPTRMNILKDIGKLISASKDLNEVKEGFKNMVLGIFEIKF